MERFILFAFMLLALVAKLLGDDSPSNASMFWTCFVGMLILNKITDGNTKP